MDIIRSKLNVQDYATANWFEYIISIFKHDKVKSTWKNHVINNDSNTDEKTATFYINEDVYIKMIYIPTDTGTPSKFSIALYSYGYTNDIFSTNNLSTYISHITIFKQNTCTGFILKFSDYTVNGYSLNIPILIDSINNNPNNIVVLYPSASSSRFYTSVSDASIINHWYYDADSSSTGTNTIQLVPFVISTIDAQFDTLYGVCISPVMNRFVMFNNEKWLLTSGGIAIPCGDEINYYYVD